MLNLSKSNQKLILSKVSKSSTNSISSKELNEILLNSLNKPKKSNNTDYKKKKYDYKFMFDVEKINEYEYKFILTGKHIATNTFNGFVSLGRRSAYKNSIKNAAYNFYLIHKRKYLSVLPNKPFEKVTIEPIAYNPKSRDDDGCSVTIKTLRDMLTVYKFIKDDNRKHLLQLPTREVISKDYKIELLLKVEKSS